MKCQKCDSDRVMTIDAKCSDQCSASIKDVERCDYAPYVDCIGGGDYIRFNVCLECGQMQGEFPEPDPEFYTNAQEDE